jgi:hypothetical protein
MPQVQVIIHERLGRWAGQLRPRFQGWPVRWSETRSTSALVRASKLSTCPIFVIDLGERPLRGLEDLDEAIRAAPSGLSVILDPGGRPEVASLARELGVTLVLGGVVVPPVVESLLRRWIPLAVQRAEREGWSPSIEPEPEFWEKPDLLEVAPPLQAR